MTSGETALQVAAALLPPGEALSLPVAGTPRLLVLRGADAADRFGDASFFPASSARGRVLKTASRAAAWCGLGRRLTRARPGVLGALVPDAGAVRAAVLIGPDLPSRKAVARLTHPDGR
ncbi:MAG: hypothetical protein FDZ70_02020, partial [Actinobacteria bacterium]